MTVNGDEEIRKVVREVLRDELGDTDFRNETRIWLEMQIQKDKDRKEMWKKVKSTLIGQFILWATVGVGTAVANMAWQYFKVLVKELK